MTPKQKIHIFFDAGHGSNTKGKSSPDKSLLEWQYTREIRTMIASELESQGYLVHIVNTEDWDVSLKERVRRINTEYTKLKKLGETAICISIHNNAAGSDNKWHNARGWSVFISNNASQNSKHLADCLYDAAELSSVKTRKPSPNQKYWTANLYICKNTNCPCVLTENFFMDNEAECKWLLSEQGKQAVSYIHTEGIKKYIC